eukprot:g5939.t1
MLSSAAATTTNSNGRAGDDSHAHNLCGIPAFTSGDAHNGCRALFNGVAGWAFFGPAGFIDPNALPPGTESFPCDFKPRGKKSPSRPGEGVGRKTNDARSAYLDAEDLRHLVRGTSERDVDDGEGATALRKGRPIVLTLQAILAATSPASPAAAAIEAAVAVAAAGARAEERDSGARRRRPPETGEGCPPPVAIADRAQFPPLMLRGASADKGPGLFLAPPITMVKHGAPVQPAGQPDAAGEAGLRAESGGDADAGRAARSKGPIEDEDPYYARKRVGAFAFKTKPRGKAHRPGESSLTDRVPALTGSGGKVDDEFFLRRAGADRFVLRRGPRRVD